MASFRGLRNAKFDTFSNETMSLTSLPSNVLDAFIPGYSILSRIIKEVVGVDIGSTVSVAIMLVALLTGSSFLTKHVSQLFLHFFSSSINIDNEDALYDYILAWAAKNPSVQKVRSLRGHSAGEAVDADNPLNFMAISEDQIDEDSIFNFNDWAAKAPPQYEPHSYSGLFWHKSTITGKWNIFSINRDREQVRAGFMGMMVRDREKLTLTVLGRSTVPLKDLIVEMRDDYLSQRTSMTAIRRPAPKEQRGRGRSAWNKVSSRPSRPMATVVLDDEQKATILKDMNEFLHPAMSRWYANRGIPYRRGYLFHGPPGTGKTSLSFALAGVFGLDIFCLSLSEATLTEEDLILLFNSLPKRCVVLLEDIDSAGVLRKNEEADDQGAPLTLPDKGKSEKDELKAKRPDTVAETAKQAEKSEPIVTKSEQTVIDATATAIASAITTALESSKSSPKERRGRPPASAFQSQVGPDGKETQTGITLSGLLNAIDGVASQEGRVLVMTTNFPEKLDSALVRPGRVDLKVAFGLAGRKEMRELFQRMYEIKEEDGKAARRPRMATRMSDILPKSGSDNMDEEDDEIVLHLHTGRKADGQPRISGLPTPPGTPTTSLTTEGTRHPQSASLLDSRALDKHQTDIPYLARLFASKLPPAVFSPAEIQGFLLTRKRSPVQAVLDVDRWRDEELGRKDRGSNVATAKASAKTDGGP